jgi:intracellular septation protein A
MRTRSDMALLMRAMLPLLVWFVSFSLLYGVVTLACGLGVLAGGMQDASLVLIVATLIALAIIAGWTLEADPFLAVVRRGLCLIAMLAICWMLVPLIILGTC